MLAQALGEAAAAARGVSQPVSTPEMACAAVMRALVGTAPSNDDVALLVLHRSP